MFYSDQPITSDEEDKLGRKRFANVLANTIISIDNSETYTIGINGKWGCGKTSTVNMAINEIEAQKRNQINVIRFEAWNCSTVEQMISQFFKVMSNELASSKERNLVEVSNMISNYAGFFESMSIVPYVGTIARLLAQLTGDKALKRAKVLGEENVQTQKQAIADALKNTKKRYIIVIDDIDRLNRAQIRMVFQLVKEIANFPNITYLLVFDMDIVTDALGDEDKKKGEEYLEKIVQMLIGIPEPNESALNSIFSERMDDLVRKYQAHFDRERLGVLLNWILMLCENSIREINRLYNALDYKLVLLHNQVDFVDLVILTALELKYNSIYSWVKDHKALLVDDHTMYTSKRVSGYDMKNYSYYKEQIDKVYSSESVQTTAILGMLADIFPRFQQKIFGTKKVYDEDYYRHINAVCCEDRFDCYFQFDTSTLIVDMRDVERFVNAKTEEEAETYKTKYEDKGALLDFYREVKARIASGEASNMEQLFYFMINDRELYLVENIDFAFSSVINGIRCSLVNALVPETRKDVIVIAIKNSTLESIDTCIKFCDTIKERRDSDEESTSYLLMNADEIVEIHETLILRTKDLLENKCIFDIEDWEVVQRFVLRNIGEEYYNEHIEKYCVTPYHYLCKYTTYIGAWIGTNNEYEVTQELLEKIGNERDRVLEQIIGCLKNKSFYRLKSDQQGKICALWIYLRNPAKFKYNRVSEKLEVIPQLNRWRKEYNI